MKGLSRHDIAGSARRNVSVECQGPQESRRRVYSLNVSGYLVHVQIVSLKSETDYGRAGALISRCATIYVVRSTVLYGRESAMWTSSFIGKRQSRYWEWAPRSAGYSL
jgi:hypothetical protein